MDNSRNLTKLPVTTGEAAVNGLLTGIFAGSVMLLVLVGGGMLFGVRFAEMLGRFDVSGHGLPLTGGLTHFSVAAVYGAVYGLLWKLTRPLRLPDWLRGTVYSLALFLLAQFIFLPAGAGPGAPALLALSAAAHLAYGLVLALSLKQFMLQEAPEVK